jgi:hypothetical protein
MRAPGGMSDRLLVSTYRKIMEECHAMGFSFRRRRVCLLRPRGAPGPDAL